MAISAPPVEFSSAGNASQNICCALALLLGPRCQAHGYPTPAPRRTTGAACRPHMRVSFTCDRCWERRRSRAMRPHRGMALAQASVPRTTSCTAAPVQTRAGPAACLLVRSTCLAPALIPGEGRSSHSGLGRRPALVARQPTRVRRNSRGPATTSCPTQWARSTARWPATRPSSPGARR